MSVFEVLSKYDAFAKPADLWCLGSPGQSTWTQEIDYYLNFQISKSFKKESQLLVLSLNRLPSKYNLILSFDENFPRKIYKAWNELKKPSLKIFLPCKSTEKITSNLKKTFSEETISIDLVEDKR